MNNGIRRAPQAYPNTPKQLPQHAPSYQQQAFNSQQPPQAPYPHHIFSNPNTSPVHSLTSVQNGARSQQSHPQLPVPSSRQVPRTTTHHLSSNNHQMTSNNHQMPSNNTPLNYLINQQQPMNQQSVGQQMSMTQHVPQTEKPIITQPPPQHTHPAQQPVLTPQPPQSQLQQPPQPPPPQQIQPDTSVQSQDTHQDDTMEVESQGDSMEGDESALDKTVDNPPFQPRSPMGPMMSAPPEGGSYPTLDAVHKAVLEYCTSVGYAIVIGRSKKTVPGLKKVLFVCDRAGKPPKRVSPEMRKRKTSSRKCDCQFGFFAIEQRTQWTVRYRPDAQHLSHNHGPSESPLLHPAARKLDSKMVAAVKALKENGVGVSQTLEILQAENPHVPLLPRDIYNARAAINRNPQKITAGLAEDRPAIYSKPHPSAEERIRADLRRELAKAREDLDKIKDENQKKIDELEEKLREKDKIIKKYEMFVDLCNERVMIQREKLNDIDDSGNGGSGSRS